MYIDINSSLKIFFSFFPQLTAYRSLSEYNDDLDLHTSLPLQALSSSGHSAYLQSQLRIHESKAYLTSSSSSNPPLITTKSSNDASKNSNSNTALGVNSSSTRRTNIDCSRNPTKYISRGRVGRGGRIIMDRFPVSRKT